MEGKGDRLMLTPCPCFSLCLSPVLLVGTVTATNNYNKERQFRSLEETAKKDDRIFIKRGKCLSP